MSHLWREILTLQVVKDTGVNTLWPPPCLLDSGEAVRLVTLEFVSLLLDDGRAGK